MPRRNSLAVFPQKSFHFMVNEAWTKKVGGGTTITTADDDIDITLDEGVGVGETDGVFAENENDSDKFCRNLILFHFNNNTITIRCHFPN